MKKPNIFNFLFVALKVMRIFVQKSFLYEIQ